MVNTKEPERKLGQTKPTPPGSAAKTAVQDAAKALKAAQATADKALKQAAQAKVAADVGAKLDPIAKEVNERLEKAEKSDKNADDHRLAAILKLEEARLQIEKLGKTSPLSFNKWCASNIQWSPETIRKMLPIAQSSNPKAALEDLRAGNKERNKKSRDKKKTAAKKPTLAIAAAPATPKALQAVIQSAKPEVQLAAVKKTAEDMGLRVVSEADAEKAGGIVGVDAVQIAWQALKPVDRMKVARFIAESLGFDLVTAVKETVAA